MGRGGRGKAIAMLRLGPVSESPRQVGNMLRTWRAGRSEQIELTVKGTAERAISLNCPVIAVKEDLQSTSWPTNGTLIDRRAAKRRRT